MKPLTFLRDQSGYTLLETVVALALLTGVLVPLGSAVGTLLLSDKTSSIYDALAIAQSEISAVSSKNVAAGRTTIDRDGMRIAKEILLDGELIEIRVSVASLKMPEKRLVSLQKTILGPR
jgi:hypothetical protein